MFRGGRIPTSLEVSKPEETKATSSSPVLVNDAVKSVEVKKSEEATPKRCSHIESIEQQRIT